MKNALLFSAALVLTACATPSTDTHGSNNTAREEKQYRVGSRIPVKDAVGASPTATMDPSVLSNLPSRPAN